MVEMKRPRVAENWPWMWGEASTCLAAVVGPFWERHCGAETRLSVTHPSPSLSCTQVALRLRLRLRRGRGHCTKLPPPQRHSSQPRDSFSRKIFTLLSSTQTLGISPWKAARPGSAAATRCTVCSHKQSPVATTR